MVIRRRWGVLALASVLAVSACGGANVKPAASPQTVRTDLPADLQDVAMDRPGPYRATQDVPDILIQSQTTLPVSVLEAVARTKGVSSRVQFSLATFYAEETAVTYAAVNPATFRQFAYKSTAALDEIWDRIADGEIALRNDLKQGLATTGDYIVLGNDDNAQRAHIGAYAPLVERSKIGAVLNERWADKLRMPKGNALLVSAGKGSPTPLLKKLRQAIGKQATVTLLAPNVNPNEAQTAVLVGGSIAQAVGSFTYTANRDGTVVPEARWVTPNIRTEQVPILGNVTCHKVMLVQLRAALQEVVDRGLASKIHPNEYGGCYVPRFIARDPARGLSFHTFGTAVDLNVPGNLRGVPGEIDRTVVAIFKKWGFSWGGDWNYTDPMHFELARLVSVR